MAERFQEGRLHRGRGCPLEADLSPGLAPTPSTHKGDSTGRAGGGVVDDVVRAVDVVLDEGRGTVKYRLPARTGPRSPKAA